MNAAGITIQEIIVAISCGECHVTFGMNESMWRARKRDGKHFWCPNGDKISYYESEESLLKQKLAQVERQRDSARARNVSLEDQLGASERSRSALKGVVTRTKNKLAAGSCPVGRCEGHFVNLQEHMENEHPGFELE